jgi:hypothetical protein
MLHGRGRGNPGRCEQSARGPRVTRTLFGSFWGRPPISGLPEIGSALPKSATADLGGRLSFEARRFAPSASEAVNYLPSVAEVAPNVILLVC